MTIRILPPPRSDVDEIDLAMSRDIEELGASVDEGFARVKRLLDQAECCDPAIAPNFWLMAQTELDEWERWNAQMFDLRRVRLKRRWLQLKARETVDGRLALAEHERNERIAAERIAVVTVEFQRQVAAGVPIADVATYCKARVAELAGEIVGPSAYRLNRIVYGAQRVARAVRRRTARQLIERRRQRACAERRVLARPARDRIRDVAPPRRRYSRPRGPPIVVT
jgi:hypothetical protein